MTRFHFSCFIFRNSFDIVHHHLPPLWPLCTFSRDLIWFATSSTSTRSRGSFPDNFIIVVCIVSSARTWGSIIIIIIVTGDNDRRGNSRTAVSRETPESDNDATCAELKADEVWKSANNSRPVSISSEPENRWIDLVSGEWRNVSFLKFCCFLLLAWSRVVGLSSVHRNWSKRIIYLCWGESTGFKLYGYGYSNFYMYLNITPNKPFRAENKLIYRMLAEESLCSSSCIFKF